MKKQFIFIFYLFIFIVFTSSCIASDRDTQTKSIKITSICNQNNIQELTKIVREEKNQIIIKQIDEQFNASKLPKNTTITRKRWRLLRSLGFTYDEQSMYDKSLEIYRLGLAIVKLAEDSELEAIALHDLGFSFKNLKQYPEALECYQKALSISKQIKSDLVEEGQVATLNNIGEVYRNLKQYERALMYYQQGLAIAENHQDPDMRPILQILLKNIEEVKQLSEQ